MLATVLSPYAYTPEMVPAALKIIIYMNPISYFVLMFQQLIVYSNFPDIELLIFALFLSISFLYLGIKVFKKTKQIYIDHV